MGLCYFLDFDDIELCVLEGLPPEGELHSLAELGSYPDLFVETSMPFQNGPVFVSEMGEWPALG